MRVRLALAALVVVASVVAADDARAQELRVLVDRTVAAGEPIPLTVISPVGGTVEVVAAPRETNEVKRSELKLTATIARKRQCCHGFYG